MSSFLRFTGDDKSNEEKKTKVVNYGGKNEYGIKVANKVLDFVGNIGGPITAPFTLAAKLMLSISTSSFFTKEMIDKIKGYHKNLEEYSKLLNVFDYLEKNSDNVISYPLDLSGIQTAIGNQISYLYGFISSEKDKNKKDTVMQKIKRFAKQTLIAYTLESIDLILTSSMTQVVADMVSLSSNIMMQLFSLSATNNALYTKLVSNTMTYYVKPEESPKLSNIETFYEIAKPEIENVVNEISDDIQKQKQESQQVEGQGATKITLPATLTSTTTTMTTTSSTTDVKGGRTKRTKKYKRKKVKK